MQTVKFEADIKNNSIEIPPQYKGIIVKHVKVIVMIDEAPPKYDFSSIEGKLEWDGDCVKAQRELRDEW